MIDLVHDIVGSYRALVMANSYPGDVKQMNEYIKGNDIEVPFYQQTLLFIFMLLDAEVTFAVVGDYDDKAVDMISKLTYAKPVAMTQADFIFVLQSSTPTDVKRAIRNAKIGTLIDPHKSATLICEVESVVEGERLTLTGPGIKVSKDIHIEFIEDLPKYRYEKNKEYPLGIEMYFIDKDGRLMALPRTTQVKGCDN